MSRRLKTLEWKTNSIKIDFSNTPESPLGWALKAISEYKVIPATLTLYTEGASEVSIPDLFLRNSKGALVKPSANVNVALDLVQADWNTLILWVVKDRWKLFDIFNGPIPEMEMRIHEPRAKLVIAELELWDAIYDANREFKTALPYDNCVEAWKLTQLESKRVDFLGISSGGQREKISDLAKKKRELTQRKNLFNPNNCNQAHHHNMIAAALSIVVFPGREQEAVGKVRKKFQEEKWNPYLNAMGEYIKSLSHGVTLPDGSVVKPKIIFVNEDGDLMLQDGRQAKKIWSILRPTQKKYLNQRGQYQRK